MRLGVVFVLFLVAGVAQGQIALGPGGLQTPPINLIAVFRFIRDIVVAIFTPNPVSEVKNSDIDILTKEIAETRNDVLNEVETSDNNLTNDVSVIGFDEEGNIVEKRRGNVEEKEESENIIIERFDFGDDFDLEDGTETQKTTASGAVVVGTWPLIYLGIISVLFWGLVIVATPYVLTGEPIGRREDIVSGNSIVPVDEQDILLLLSWLLGEASLDRSCLKRVICMSPLKSSRYLHVSSMVMNVAEYFQSWGVPYSAGYDDLLRRLSDVAQDGLDNSCQSYFCSTLPDF